MDEEEWGDDHGEDIHEPALPQPPTPNYTYISKTTETMTSRQAVAQNLPATHIHSTKVFRRNEFIISAFIGCALYSLFLGVASLLFGLLNGGLLLFAVHVAECLYFVFAIRSKYFYAQRAPLRFLPVLVLQGVSLAVVILRAHVMSTTVKRIFWLQVGFFGAPAVLCLAYFGGLVLRSLGVQWLKFILPHYYVYLNLADVTSVASIPSITM